MRISTFLKEISGIITAFIFLSVGFLVAYFAQAMKVTMGDAVLVFLLLTPLIVYLVLTGRLAGLKGPGGLEATFASLAEAPAMNLAAPKVEMIAASFAYIDAAMSSAQKTPEQELETLHSKLDELPPVILKVYSKRNPAYKRDELTHVVENLLFYQTFKMVCIIDCKERFLAFLPSWAFYRILIGAEGERFLRIVNEGEIEELWDFPGMQQTYVRAGTDIVQALKVMHENRLDSILVLDDKKRVVNVIERDQVVSKLLMKMMHPRFRKDEENAQPPA
ncbi:MAG: hypothetical protein EHM21_06770 [Chloroflexi bacterium]|nr:MAG: hypothetical protein EHM21_06770 [Chloroflexota bacterium]